MRSADVKQRLLPVVAKDEDDKANPQSSVLGLSPTLVSGLTYCLVSASMVLLNKLALSSFHFTAPISLLTAQCAASVVFIKILSFMGVCKVEPLRWDIVKVWLPVNAVFVCMLASGIVSLQLLGVAMVTIMKNLTNLITISGDYFFFGRTYNIYVWMCLLIIIVSACTGMSTDLAFSFSGYSFQIANCFFTAGYSLLLRGTMDKVTGALGRKMDTASEVYLNNLLSIPLLLVLVVGFGEHRTVPIDPALRSPIFLFVAFVSCVIGFSISYATLWFLSTTTATTYSLVGSLNKIPVAIIGIFAFSAPTSTDNLASIGLGLIGGVLFVRAKQLQK